MKHLSITLLSLSLGFFLTGCDLFFSTADSLPSSDSVGSRQLENLSPSDSTKDSTKTNNLITSEEVSQLMQSETYIVTLYPGLKAEPPIITSRPGDFVLIKNNDISSHQIGLGNNTEADIQPGSAHLTELKTIGEHPILVDGSQVSLIKVQ